MATTRIFGILKTALLLIILILVTVACGTNNGEGDSQSGGGAEGDNLVGMIVGNGICLNPALGGFEACVEIEHEDDTTSMVFCDDPIPCNALARGQKVRLNKKFSNHYVIVEIIEGQSLLTDHPLFLPTTEEPQKTEIVWGSLYYQNFDKDMDIFSQITDRINNKYEEIDLSISSLSGVSDPLGEGFVVMDVFDIAWLAPSIFNFYASSDLLLDLRPLIEADPNVALEDFYPVLINELDLDGAIYGLPRRVDSLAVYYNVDLFENAGLKTPRELQMEGNWTWETMYDSALALTDPSEGANTWGLDIPPWSSIWLSLVMQAGGDLLNAEETACALNSEATTATFDFLNKIYQGNDENPPVAPAQYAEINKLDLFEEGKLAMFWDGRRTVSMISEDVNFNWDVVELPAGSAGPANFVFWDIYTISINTRDFDLAFSILKEIMNQDSMNLMTELGTYVPPTVAQDSQLAFLASLPPDNNLAFLSPMSYAKVFDFSWTTRTSDLFSILDSETRKVFAGELSPEEFSNSICDQIDPLIGQ